ncbi:basic region leucine zipper [Cooperia oncophora]
MSDSSSPVPSVSCDESVDREEESGASSEPCSAAEETSPTKPLERRRGEKEADYYERRRKNNDSARRSREVRRLREAANRQQVEALKTTNVHYVPKSLCFDWKSVNSHWC